MKREPKEVLYDVDDQIARLFANAVQIKRKNRKLTIQRTKEGVIIDFISFAENPSVLAYRCRGVMCNKMLLTEETLKVLMNCGKLYFDYKDNLIETPDNKNTGQ